MNKLTQAEADAYQQGALDEAALWRDQIRGRDRSGIMALDRELAHEEGVAQGRAEVTARVDAVLTEWLAEAARVANAAGRYGEMPAITLTPWKAASQIRAALADTLPQDKDN